MENVLLEILKGFFNSRTAVKFSEKNIMPKVSHKANTSRLTTSRKSEPSSFSKVNVQIDLIITYAEDNLPLQKFVELLLQLGEYSICTGEFSSAVYIFEKILSKTKINQELKNFTAHSYRSLGEIFSRQALWEISLNYIKRAIEIYSKLENTEGIAECENLLGTIYGDLGNLSDAQIHFEKAHSMLNGKLVKSLLASKIKTNLGIINNIQGDLEKALEYYMSALSDYENTKDLRRMAEVRHNIGMLYSRLSKFNSAHKEFNHSIKLSQKLGDLQTLGLSYIGKANLYAVQKEFSLGDEFARKALEICHETKDMLSIADIYKIKGIIQRELGNYDNATNYLLTSLRLNKELKNQLNKAETELELGMLFKKTGKEIESKTYFRNAKRYYNRIGDNREIERINELLLA